MKHLSIIAFLLLVSVSCKDTSRPKNTFDLSQGWEFREAGKGNWLPATVPGTVHSDLLDNGIIQDPFYRLNELSVQWIDKSDWEYRCAFNADAALIGQKNQELVFEGLDTYADVYLNDSLILSADNMFRTWRVDIGRYILPGKNNLRVLLKSPTREGLARMEAYGLELPAGNDQSERGEMETKRVSPFVRKAPYHFGWDWGPRLVTSGIWRPARIETWDNCRISHVRYTLESLDSSTARYTASISTESDEDTQIEARILVNGEKVAEKKLKVQKGSRISDIAFDIADPVLWWPNGAGSQTLYDLRVELGPEEKPVDSREEKIGIRDLRLLQPPDPDGRGAGFYFEVNGRPIFAKGANYIPNDVFLDRVTPADYEFIVRSAAEANMNMLRVWGGGIYEEDLFYELCDQYGILIWQDFMFACSMYPGNDEFLASVRQEAIENVVRLRNHPCLALWCGNNEIEIAWAEWEENRGWGWKQQYDSLQRKKIWAAYDTLFHFILKDVSEEYSGIPYWHSSPSAGYEKLASYVSTSGDMHYWGVWHGMDPLEDFRNYRARFMSEYGFQSFPEFNSVKRYTVPGDWDIESEVMASHQRSGIGNLRIQQYMQDNYKVPSDFEQFLYTGQLLQAEAIRLAIESHRADMPYNMGSLYWQINDCWPVASWSGIDYYKRWKALHYFAREAFKEVILVFSADSGQVTGKIVSDRPEAFEGELTLNLIDFNGNLIAFEALPVSASANSSSIIYKKMLETLLSKGDPSNAVLVAELYEKDQLADRCLFYFVLPKDMKLPDPKLNYSVTENNGRFLISLTSEQLAKNVFLSVEGCEGQFSDNYFDILPGETTTVSIPGCMTLEEFSEKLKILHQ